MVIKSKKDRSIVTSSSVQAKILNHSYDRLTIFSRRSPLDYDSLKAWSSQLMSQGKSILWVNNHPQVYRGVEVSMMIYLNQMDKTPIEIAYALTLFVLTEQFDIVVLDGSLVDLSAHYPRLRWILHQYQSHLVILID